jgi:dTDP-4-amino-4,6-dideoxygalactose transaminase
VDDVKENENRKLSVAMTIPLVDLIVAHKELEDDLMTVCRQALQTGQFVGGAMVESFESQFAEFCDARHCVGVGSGTDALRLALMAGGVRQGDTVITVPNTFIATAEAICQAGACPEFVDMEHRTHTMSPVRLQEYLENECFFDRRSGKLTSRRRQKPVTALVPVHLYGQMADMDPLLSLAARYGLIVIEDACQAHGAQYFSRAESAWRKAGSMGAAAAFSFYPGKNLGACGEGGAVVTNNEHIAKHVMILRDHGQTVKYHHELEGCNSRLDAIQAGILQAKLHRLPEWNRRRREIAERYNRIFAPLADHIESPWEPPWGRSVYHLYVIRHLEPTALKTHLAARGICCGIHYPTPIHLQEAYRRLRYRTGDFPVAEKAASQILSLPIYPQLTLEQQTLVGDMVLDFVQASAHRTVACSD